MIMEQKLFDYWFGESIRCEGKGMFVAWKRRV